MAKQCTTYLSGRKKRVWTDATTNMWEIDERQPEAKVTTQKDNFSTTGCVEHKRAIMVHETRVYSLAVRRPLSSVQGGQIYTSRGGTRVRWGRWMNTRKIRTDLICIPFTQIHASKMIPCSERHKEAERFHDEHHLPNFTLPTIYHG